MGANPRCDPPDDKPDENAPDGDEDKAPERPDHRHRRRGGGGTDGRAVDRERGGVVQEALALEDADDPPRDRESLRDRGGGHRVGGRNDRPQGSSEGP